MALPFKKEQLVDERQVKRNREVVEDSTAETPWNADISDSDADWGEQLYDNLPDDRVGFMPGEKKSKR